MDNEARLDIDCFFTITPDMIAKTEGEADIYRRCKIYTLLSIPVSVAYIHTYSLHVHLPSNLAQVVML
jgi:hypothetical protein